LRLWNIWVAVVVAVAANKNWSWIFPTTSCIEPQSEVHQNLFGSFEDETWCYMDRHDLPCMHSLCTLYVKSMQEYQLVALVFPATCLQPFIFILYFVYDYCNRHLRVLSILKLLISNSY
jgi:hypothetical protein